MSAGRPAPLRSLSTATIDTLERYPATTTAMVETQHGTRRVADETQHERVTGSAVAQDRPQKQEPVPADISAGTYRCAHDSFLACSAWSVLTCIHAEIREAPVIRHLQGSTTGIGEHDHPPRSVRSAGLQGSEPDAVPYGWAPATCAPGTPAHAAVAMRAPQPQPRTMSVSESRRLG